MNLFIQCTHWLSIVLVFLCRFSTAAPPPPGGHYAFDINVNEPPPFKPFNIQPPADPPGNKLEDFLTLPDRFKHGAFLAKIMETIMKKGLFFNEARSTPPYTFKTPEELAKLMDLKVGEDGTPFPKLYEIVSQLIDYSPHVSHPFTLTKRLAGLDPYAMAGDWLANTMTNLVVKYNVAPVWTVMEHRMQDELAKLYGWSDPKQVQGVSTSGGGAGNGLAVAIGIQQKWPLVKNEGLVGSGNPKAALFVSEGASGAFEKAQVYQGLAAKWLIKVSTNPRTGRMDLADLETKIKKANADGLKPFMVVGTAGTTLLGAVDDLDGIGKIAAANKLWFHVDAVRAGGAIFEPGRIKGLQKADSVLFGAWMFQTPYVQSTYLLAKGNDTLHSAFSLHAPYVWAGLGLYKEGIWDNGDNTVQTSRRPEIAKWWFTWKARGTSGLREHVKVVYQNTAEFVAILKGRPNFELLLDSYDSPQVSFYYKPASAQKLDLKQEANVKRLSGLQVQIKMDLLKRGLLFISTGDIGPTKPIFLIVTLTNSVLSSKDLVYIADTIQQVGDQQPPAAGRKKRAASPPNNKGLAVPVLKDDIADKRPFVNAPLKKLHEGFLVDVFQMFLSKGIFFSRKERPTNFVDPEQLEKVFDFKLGNEPTKHADLLKLFGDVIKYSPHWAHPYFIYQLATGLDPFTLAADYVASTINSPLITYEDSPVYTLMEMEVMKAFRKRIFGKEEGDGRFTDGGSMANQMAIALARHAKDQKIKTEGIGYQGKKYVLFISEDGHYSTRKGSIIQGMGGENAVYIEASVIAQMDMKILEAAIKKSLAAGDIPFMVVLTMGTTIYGAIDNIAEAVVLCEKYKLWCHVDGMFGGLIAMSDKHIKSVKSIEKVDSFGVDLHKLMGSTMVMSALITRRKGIFKDTFATNSPADYSTRVAPYLYKKDDWDLGDHHWQVEKRNNLFKFWFMWKARGRKGMGQHVDRIMDNAKFLTDELHRRDGFEPVIKTYEVTNICFWYIPPGLRKLDRKSAEWKTQMQKVSFAIERKLTVENVMSIVTQSRKSIAGGTAIFIKFVMMGSALTKEDIKYLLDAVEHYGNMEIPEGRAGDVPPDATNEEIFSPFGNNPQQWAYYSLDALYKKGKIPKAPPKPPGAAAAGGAPAKKG